MGINSIAEFRAYVEMITWELIVDTHDLPEDYGSRSERMQSFLDLVQYAAKELEEAHHPSPSV